ncbi:MAG TPA: serine/threonine-protein kinase [Gemmatimonadales bacterium]|nr:serine/threonine-protein kinase [Gemmatimonadales bacterium]
MAPETQSYCARCGTSLAPGAYFCLRCGTSVPVTAGSASATVAPPPPPRRTPPAQHAAQLDALRQATLGEYEILAELGHGGMATVYLAHDLALDRKVAIKVLAPALLLMGEGMVERFKREARTAAALSHPHIIPIYAVKEREHVLFFVMKYVQGRALDTVIRDVGTLPIPMVQTILAHAGDALGYAHRHGVIHRDIKSANLMLDEDGWAVITDFGIAKVVQAEGLTMTGVTVGTPTYMSPEQCETRDVTGASDQYSLGVVAYEMLTGRLPFRGDSTMAVMYAHFNERPRPVAELRPDCPPNLAAGVMRMLEKDPARRWPSMDDIVAVCGRPSLRHDDPVRGEMITLAKAGAGSALMAHVKTPTSPLVLSKPQTHAATVAIPHARTSSRLWWGLGGLGGVAIAAAIWWLAPWRPWQASRAPAPAPPHDTARVAQANAAAPTDTVSTRRAPVPTPPRAPARSSRERPPATPPAAARESAARSAVAQRDDSLLRSLRARAASAMSRAIEAGATPADLARGDTAFKGAESLAAQSRLPEAMVQLATAASLWADAERESRARAARDSEQRRAAEQAAAPAPVVTPGPVDPQPDIQKVIDDYARALESRDVGQVRRAYPGLTSAQQQSWQDFFRSTRNLKAGLTVTAVHLSGLTAEAIVSGLYEYDNASTGRAERRPVTFRAVLVVDSGGWRLTTIR